MEKIAARLVKKVRCGYRSVVKSTGTNIRSPDHRSRRMMDEVWRIIVGEKSLHIPIPGFSSPGYGWA